MNKINKPLTDWTLQECHEYCLSFLQNAPRGISEDEPSVCDKCVLRRKHICGKTPANYKFSAKRLTRDEVIMMKILGAKYVTENKTGGFVNLWDGKPLLSSSKLWVGGECARCVGQLNPYAFPSLEPGDVVCIDDAMEDYIDTF